MSRIRLALLAVAATFALAACTAVKMTYNHADDLARFMASGYVDLDDAQAGAFRARFASLHDWHRANELPRYVDLVQSAMARVRKGLSPEDVDWATRALRSRYRLLAGRAAEEAAPVLATLQPEQIRTMETKLATNNSKYFKEWLAGDAKKRERRRAERTIERFEEWTGRLSDAQRQRVEKFVRSHPRIYEIRFAERQRWQQEAVDTIKRHRNANELAPRLAKLFTDPEAGRTEEYLRENRRFEADLAQLVLDIDGTLSAEQRERMLGRMNRYAADFQELRGGSRVAGIKTADPGERATQPGS